MEPELWNEKAYEDLFFTPVSLLRPKVPKAPPPLQSWNGQQGNQGVPVYSVPENVHAERITTKDTRRVSTDNVGFPSNIYGFFLIDNDLDCD